jgi:hypothetical protein
MVKLFQILFSLPIAFAAGVGAISALVILILQEKSVQPLQNHLWAEENISAPFDEGSVFKQGLIIPEGLEQESFLLAVFFGCDQDSCVGGVEVSLSQDSHVQVHAVSGISPAPTLRHRFKFDGFSSGPAVLQIAGIAGNSESAPGLLYIVEGKGDQLEGPGIEVPAYASVDWFKVVPGAKKLTLVFPNKMISLLWLFPFAGFFILAWAGMKPTTIE